MSARSKEKILGRIYFDNDPLMGRWPARVTGELQVLARLARLVDVSLLVPETVVVEHKYSTIRHAIECMKKAAGHLDRSNSFLNGLASEQRVNELDVSAIEAAHDQAVEKAKHTHRFLTIPVTSKVLNEFVRDAASHGLAFKERDAGFRDAAHLHSVLEHIAANPLQQDEEAVFNTRDEFLAAAAIEAGRAVGLTSQKESQIVERLKAMIATPEGEQLIRLAAEWSPVILADVQINLLEDLVRAVEGTGLIPHTYAWDPDKFEAPSWVEGEQAVAPIDEQQRLWTGWIPIRMRGDVLISHGEIAVAGGSLSSVANGVIETQIGLSVAIQANDMFQIQAVSYEGATLEWFSLDGGERMSTGSPAVELLPKKVMTHPQD
jgi:hypothetical protein